MPDSTAWNVRFNSRQRGILPCCGAPILALVCGCITFLVLADAGWAWAQAPAKTSDTPMKMDDPSAITMDLIMSDPDWIGNSPERPFWSDDSGSIYYYRKRPGEDIRDLVRIDLRRHEQHVVSDADRPLIDDPRAVWSRDRSMRLFSRGGDLFLRDAAAGRMIQLTQTSEYESNPMFIVDSNGFDQRTIAFDRGGDIITTSLDSFRERQIADLRTEDDPDAGRKKDEKKDAEPSGREAGRSEGFGGGAGPRHEDFLTEQSERLFQALRDSRKAREAQQERAKAQRLADPTRLKPIYLGSGVDVRDTSLSPDMKWLLVTTVRSSGAGGGSAGRGFGGRGGGGGLGGFGGLMRGGDSDAGGGSGNGPKRDIMPQYVTDDGYVSTRPLRGKAGTDVQTGEHLLLVNINTRAVYPLDLSVLPGITDDPFAQDKPAKVEPPSANNDKPGMRPGRTGGLRAPQPRPVSFSRIHWAFDGSQVLLDASSLDFKDRWIASVDLTDHKIMPQHHEHDPAWVSEDFSSFDWLRDSNSTFFFLSEKTGYSQLYTKSLDSDSAAQLTHGQFEVSDVTLGAHSHDIYFTSNETHPGNHEVWRIDPDQNNKIEQVTHMGGENTWELSPDESKLLILHSTAVHPPELYMQDISQDAPSHDPLKLTDSTSAAFLSKPWIKPEIIEVPSTGLPGRSIYSRLYLPRDFNPEHPESAKKHPAVMFIHGAGYLQDADMGWSYYYHEFMFHTLLCDQGYIVLDMDYRASAGYGRDWRTAIYRQMGTPELVDLRDGVNYLVSHYNVDPHRVGCYGGSYGGFLTLMAMFKEPDLFACGAALRPVSDWANYSHGYTAPILDTPQIAPDAYRHSSPIEYVQGLKNPLLICHGMQDDNVFFEDTVRLNQRLLELKKQNWTVAMYPMEAHDFERPEDWLNEYRRIDKLFRDNLWKSH